MGFSALKVFLYSLGAVILIVRGIQSLDRKVWSTRRTVAAGFSVLTGLVGLYLTYRTAASLPLGTWVLAIILGVLVGAILLARVKPRWPPDS